MLSRFFIAAFMFSALSPAALARQPYGMAGCGLGSLVFGNNECQTSAATTNGSSTNQVWGIVSGTSNCVGGGSKSLVEDIQRQFMEDNYETLAKEMAQGQGETLTALSTVLGCDRDSQVAFAHTMQASFPQIYAAPGVGASLNVIRAKVRAEPQLASRCVDMI